MRHVDKSLSYLMISVGCGATLVALIRVAIWLI